MRIRHRGTGGLLAGDPEPGETMLAIRACNVWLRQGPRRSLVQLAQDSQHEHDLNPSIPIYLYNTLAAWSKDFDWAARAVAYDSVIEEMRQEEFDQQILSGLAMVAQRVKELKKLAATLKHEIYEVAAAEDEGAGSPWARHKLWLRDFKIMGKGEDAQAIPMYRFNAALVEQYRNTLNDIALEVGGRKIDPEESPASARAERALRELAAEIRSAQPDQPASIDEMIAAAKAQEDGGPAAQAPTSGET